MPPRFRLLIVTQFVSALADNALLIVTIAWLHQLGSPLWWVPLLKVSFLAPYVLLAPVLGPLADAWPKARLMAVMNAFKLLGVLALAWGLQPLLAYAIVGVAASAYAPAKYGLVTEMVPPQQLVQANAWLECSVVSAVLLGTVLGGFLVSTAFVEAAHGTGLGLWLQQAGLARETTLGPSLLLLSAVYGLAGLLNLGVPDSGRRYERRSLRWRALMRDFAQANATLWRDAEGGLSLAVTVLSWGAGAVLQFAVLRWAVDVLGLGLDRAAYLQAVVAVGVMAGALIAGRWVNLQDVRRLLPLGPLLGLLVACGGLSTQLGSGALLMALVGLAGGLLIVPMNALLQHRGYQLLTAGRSIAVQGFNENLGVLVMLGIHAALIALQLPIDVLLVGWGSALALAMGVLLLRLQHLHRRAA